MCVQKTTRGRPDCAMMLARSRSTSCFSTRYPRALSTLASRLLTSRSAPVTEGIPISCFVRSNILSTAPLIIRSMGLTEAEFRSRADMALDRLNRAFGVVSEEHDVEVLFQNGVLTIEVVEPNPGKIVISPNSPVRQIWISAQSRSFKLDWSGDDFVFGGTGEPLTTLVGRLAGEQLGVDSFQ